MPPDAHPEETLSGLENLGKDLPKVRDQLGKGLFFLNYLWSPIYITNLLGRATKGLKRKTKIIEAFSGVKTMEKPLYLVSTEIIDV